MLGISSQFAQLLAAQEGLCSIKLVTDILLLLLVLLSNYHHRLDGSVGTLAS
jgi:hypothetical protein